MEIKKQPIKGRDRWEEQGVNVDSALMNLRNTLRRHHLPTKQLYLTGERVGVNSHELTGSPDIDICLVVSDPKSTATLEAVIQEELRNTGIDFRFASVLEMKINTKRGLASPISLL